MTREEIQAVIDKGGYLRAGTYALLKPSRVTKNFIEAMLIDGKDSREICWELGNHTFSEVKASPHRATADEVKKYVEGQK